MVEGFLLEWFYAPVCELSETNRIVTRRTCQTIDSMKAVQGRPVGTKTSFQRRGSDGK